MDTVVDYYFTIIEHIADNIESLEDELLHDPEDHHLAQIHRITS
ncbi:MAG: hypothetical protein U5J63_09685 [Fodinibius sp.]|nr:hypothetical protein [Fodinibius sp.]